MDVIIRKATEGDFAQILALIKKFSIFQKTPEKVSVTLKQMTDNKDVFQCYVAELENKDIAGFASFFFVWYSWSGKALYLDDLFVKEDYRKAGVGKKLLDAVIKLGKEERCIKMRWQVSQWNSNAIAFYKKMGAVIDETEINCDLILARS